MELVPFVIELYSGLGRVDGRLRVDEGVLMIEYQAKDDVFGLIKGRPRRIRITMNDLQDVRYVRRRFRKSLLTLELSDVKLAHQIPGNNMGRLELVIDKDYRDAAQRAATRLQRFLSEHRLLSDDRELTESDLDMLFEDDD